MKKNSDIHNNSRGSFVDRTRSSETPLVGGGIYLYPNYPRRLEKQEKRYIRARWRHCSVFLKGVCSLRMYSGVQIP